MDTRLNIKETTKIEEIEGIESIKQFSDGVFQAPLIKVYTKIIYEYIGIELEVKKLSTEGSFKIECQTVNQWLKENTENTEPTASSIKASILGTREKIVLRNNANTHYNSRTMVTPVFLDTEGLAFKNFLVVKNRFDILKHNFVFKLDMIRGITLKEYGDSYLYVNVTDDISWKKYDLQDMVIIQENIAARLIETFSDLMDKRFLESKEDEEFYLKWIIEMFEPKDEALLELMGQVKLSHKLWKAMSSTQIYKAIKSWSREETEWISLNEIKMFKEKQWRQKNYGRKKCSTTYQRDKLKT